MDPFIEASGLWEDFHEKLVGEIERDLSARLPDRYVVRLAKRAYIELLDPENASRWMIPDVGIARRKRGRVRLAAAKKRRADVGAGTAVLDQPVVMHALVETEFHEAYVEIYETGAARRLVTSLEVLSPANKRRDTVGWSQYLKKRQVFLQGAANFIEIDLLRGGDRMPMQDDWPDSPYYVLVARKHEAGQCRAWPAYSVSPIPRIPVPLLPTDSDIPLELQPLVAAVYARSRYDLDYRQATSLKLTTEEVRLLPKAKRQSR
jgi:hypothetical protein